jgi:hypothetical protein
LIKKFGGVSKFDISFMEVTSQFPSIVLASSLFVQEENKISVKVNSKLNFLRLIIFSV